MLTRSACFHIHIFLRPKFIIFFFTLFIFAGTHAQIGIGTNTPDPSAILHVQDTARGFLIPRMTKLQKNAIQNPAEGLMVYQTDSPKGFWYFTNGNWRAMVPANYGFPIVIFDDDISNADAATKAIEEVGPLTQEIRIQNCSNLTSLDLSMATNLVELRITDNAVLQNVNLGGLTQIQGGLYIESCPALTTISAGALTKIGKALNDTYGLNVDFTGLTTLNFPVLKNVNGPIAIYLNSALTSINMPALVKHKDYNEQAYEFTISDNTALTSIILTSLNSTGALEILRNRNLSSINLSSLATASGVVITNATALTSISFPALVGPATVQLAADSSLNNISFPVLANDGHVNLGNNPLMTNLNMPALVTGQTVFTGCSGLSGVSCPVLRSGSVYFYNTPALATLSLPAFDTGSIYMPGPSLITSLSLPAMRRMQYSNIAGNNSLTSISCPLLTQVDAAVINNNANLASIT
ncbi:MAG: hypothetical protein QM737_23620 [Ferruginibacter sp.]